MYLSSIYAVVNLHSIATAIVAFFNAIVESVNQTYKFGYFFPNILRRSGGNKWTRTTDIKMLMWVRLLFPEHLTMFWWEQVDSNHRPHAYQACALTSWAMFPYKLFCSSVPKVESASLWAINSYQLLVVEVSGIEPLTPCLQGRCSPSWAIPPTCL